MKRFIALFIALVGFSFTSIAQDINNNPDSIIGEYLADRGGSKSKVRVLPNW
ncbi:MAG: hypothetical protein IIW11_04345 [Bacteroidales bacterium]|nr:hypothetical protein [Bacteroidales bacterium]